MEKPKYNKNTNEWEIWILEYIKNNKNITSTMNSGIKRMLGDFGK